MSAAAFAAVDDPNVLKRDQTIGDHGREPRQETANCLCRVDDLDHDRQVRDKSTIRAAWTIEWAP